jgi:peptide/nickel transport system permease protein
VGKFLLRRLVNYLVLVSLAAVVGYFLAANALNPRSRFEERNPPPPASTINRLLDDVNMNDRTPVTERFGEWAGGVIHADFGKQINGDPIWPGMKRRMGPT